MYYKSSMEICWIQLLPDRPPFLQHYHVIHMLLKFSLCSILLLLNHGKLHGLYEVHNFQWKLDNEIHLKSVLHWSFPAISDYHLGNPWIFVLVYFHRDLRKPCCILWVNLYMTKKMWIKMTSFYFVVSASK